MIFIMGETQVKEFFRPLLAVNLRSPYTKLGIFKIQFWSKSKENESELKKGNYEVVAVTLKAIIWATNYNSVGYLDLSVTPAYS